MLQIQPRFVTNFHMDNQRKHFDFYQKKLNLHFVVQFMLCYDLGWNEEHVHRSIIFTLDITTEGFL